MSAKGTEKINNLDANIVIIGSGGGMVAAATAAGKGVEGIIVLEKNRTLGGTSKMAQGFCAFESPVQQREQFLIDRDLSFKTYMSYDNWTTIDPRVLRAFINKSGDTVRWFQEKGVHFELKCHAVNQSRVLHWPLKGEGPDFGRGAELIRVLTKECQKLGVETLTHTMATRLIRDPQGNIAGVAAVKDGREFQIKTRSVIIATGGPGMSSDHLSGDPDYDGPSGAPAPRRDVDGVKLAEEIGAAIIKEVTSHGHHGDLDYRAKGGLAFDKNEPLVHVATEPYTVIINKLGKRYIDEASYGYGTTGPTQPGNLAFVLFDEQIRRDMEEKGVLVGKGWGRDESAVRTGLPGLEKALQKWSRQGDEPVAKITDSWDEMAKWTGADPEVLKAEIDEYNAYCDHGYDEIFAKERRFLRPLRTPPYYGLRIIAGWDQMTQGKIKINEHMGVIDTEYKAIPGLYAAGIVTGGWSGCREYPGTHLGFTMTSGRISGENAAEYVKSMK